ncbi:hypothetical protein WBW39_09360 [Pectobacterium versatile]|uniref:hypothetical protein n=1 Tax=Pectobacterium versatile TaxID=2488639 RepID=UPI0039B3B7B9
MLTQVIGCNGAQAQFPTLSMQCLQVTTGILTQVAGCSGAAQAQAPAQAQDFVSLPGCVHTGQTACCSNEAAQAQFPTLSMQCLQVTTGILTQVAGCSGAAQAQAPAQAQTFLSLPGCVHTGQTACCSNETAQAQFPTLSMQCLQVTTGILTQVAGCSGAAQAQAPAQAQTFLSLPGCVHTGQTACCSNEAAQAQFPTLSMQCLQVTTGILTQVAGCSGAAQAQAPAQAQTYFPSAVHCLSLGHCPTIQAPAQEQAFVSLPGCVYTGQTACCSNEAAQAQFPTLSMQCLQVTTGILTQVAGCKAPAQAQFPTLSMQCVGITTNVLTQIAGCNGAAPAQAQTPPTITIPQDCGVSWNCATKPPKA